MLRTTIPGRGWWALWAMVLSMAQWTLGLAAPVAVQLTPTKVSLRAGATRQFTIQLNGVNGPVTWSVNGVTGGNATLGTVSNVGLYTAPALDPKGPLVVRASVGSAVPGATATITWLNPEPVLTGVAPTSVNIGPVNVVLSGRGFVPGSQVFLNGQPANAIVESPNSIRYRGTLTTSGYYSLSVVNPSPGQASSASRRLTVMDPVAVTVKPLVETVRLGATRKFSAVVVNAVDKRVTWSVNGIPGGSSSVGTISSDGLYTAPWVMPSGGQVTVSATSVIDARATASGVIQLIHPVPAIRAVVPTYLTYGTQRVTITGVGFVDASTLRLGDVVFPTEFKSPTELVATITLEPNAAGYVGLRVKNPDPGAAQSELFVARCGLANPVVSYLAAARFLEQASWGPDPATVARVQQIGFDAWIHEQLTAPISQYRPTTDASDSLSKQQGQFFVNALRGADQLRQRVSFALGQIFVVSGLKTGQPRQMAPYQNMLQMNAFGTFRGLLRDVTLSPTMGVYLDMVNNDRAEPNSGLSPNENYAREVMQLFSIGTVLLKSDGTTVLDAQGQPIPTYDAGSINELARALTGWTFPGKALQVGHNKESYVGPMISVEANHDRESKTIPGGVVLPAGQSAEEDLGDVLDMLSTHPNAAPFISLRLIQHLVLSNPSSEYVGRVSEVFQLTQGDLGEVVRAILLDPEARRGDDVRASAVASDGHLREPILYVLGLMRTLKAQADEQSPVEELTAAMGQRLFYAPSVFNFYSPLYRIPGGLLAPEFQTLTSATALVRANGVDNLVTRRLGGDARFDLSPFTVLASSPRSLVDAVDHAFLFERTPPQVKAAIVDAVGAAKDSTTRVRNAIYLLTTSSLYQVAH
jgi:uncharacterized protein (DUF1800 family)